MYQLKITVDELTPDIWRTIQLPESYSLYKLHHIIQIIFGWENTKIWCFWNTDVPTTNPWLWGGGGTMWDKQVKIKSVLMEVGDKLPYVYGRGDEYWNHKIVLEKIDAGIIKGARCLDGAGAVIEDCGGVEGYDKIQDRLRHPEIDGYLGLLMVLGDEFSAEHIELKEVNRKLKGLVNYIKEFDEEHGLVF